MVKSFATSAALLVAAATAASVPDGTWPTSTGSVHFSEAHIVKAGEVFDGKMQTYERSDVSCEGQTESGADTAVFKMEPGATLKNVIIGKNQMEGVHCDKHDCTIENVWWDDVCEDALSVKGGTASSVTTVTGGGARSADDKVIQHNGYGTVKIDGFYGEDISKLYRSCGTCGVKLTAPQVIKAGEVFDGKMQTFDRSDITCSDGEGQKDTAVFLVEAGGTLKNAIIGKNQKEGVHCDDHDCTIENVWWDDVCEDALSIKGGSASSVTTVTNCGAKSASDKVVQHNGQGTVNIDGFYAENFGKLYRSCGTCGDIPRTVTLKNVYAVDPLVSVVTVNKNYGDKATLSNIRVKTSDGNNDVKVCQWSQGGSTPSNLGDGPSGTLCQYSESDVQINQ
ncbi:hypothetical protein PHYSODRAFT_329854 [Phytophthora sojae]|uniref:Probable pectate lyase F n=1 Tax=Phytophthora sojae (strain P6497) TaxID=1094619 RepID=G4ZA83_PHYSP|nr:hypothetical protein PHYSODRAFT_329854 [Phytophthora sojae]EGZ21968.1 hypothetical protein PHYSODRAFT_329854 [Phytophthora sojae]|eukprot:XP_009524685.1 hypothetical protein PHYSODRAFT_329854 [Phytophthora sojae]